MWRASAWRARERRVSEWPTVGTAPRHDDVAALTDLDGLLQRYVHTIVSDRIVISKYSWKDVIGMSFGKQVRGEQVSGEHARLGTNQGPQYGR